MKYTKILLFGFVIFSITACAPTSSPAPAPMLPTNTPLSTNTPIPTDAPQPTATLAPESTATIQLSGLLFLDANGSGMRDDASFVCPEVNASPASLEFFFPEACTASNIGQLVTVQEPGLEGISVCYDENCTTTGTDGIYSLVLSRNTDGQSVKLSITDPNAQVTSLALRYSNVWNKLIVIPEYEISEVNVPEQTLNDTIVKPIASGIDARAGSENQVGMMQGILTLPYSLIEENQWWISNYVDLDPSRGSIRTYDGSNSMLSHRQSERPGISVTGEGQQHPGIDFEGPENSYVLSSFAGSIWWIAPNQSQIACDIVLGNNHLELGYGHLNKVLIDESPLRGQIIGLNGTQDTTHPHIHYNLWDITKGEPAINIDPFRDLIIQTPLQLIYESLTNGYAKDWQLEVGSPGYFTVDNLPFFALPSY